MATGITELDVWRASDALLLEGARPTIERVRQKIGRGSPNTVSPHLESWFRSLGARIQDPGAFSAPAAVPEPVAQAAAHFWESALAAARAEQAEANRQRWAELHEEGERLDALTEQLRLREANLENRERDLQEGLKVATGQLAATEERLRAAEAQLRQRDEALAVEQRQLADARNALLAHVADAERARGEQAEALAATQERHAAHERRWLNELDAERGSVKRLQARLDELQAAQQQQAEQSRQALAQAAERLRGAQADAADQLRAAQAEILAARGEAQAQLSRQLADVAVAQEALQASRRREQDLTQRLAASDAQLADLLGQLRTRDGQLLELTRHLIAARVAVRPTPGGAK